MSSQSGGKASRIGPRLSYTILLVTASLPVMGIGLSDSYEMFLLFRLAIGITGASFVITQYHTSVMFSSNVVGTANATAAGWGNMGGVVPLTRKISSSLAWLSSRSPCFHSSSLFPGKQRQRISQSRLEPTLS